MRSSACWKHQDFGEDEYVKLEKDECNIQESAVALCGKVSKLSLADGYRADLGVAPA